MSRNKKKPAPKRLENEKGQAARKSAPIKKDTPRKQDSAKPTKYIQLNSRVTNKLGLVKPNTEQAINAWGKRAGSPKVYITLEYDEDVVSTSREITPCDKLYLNAVASLWDATDKAITTRQVWAALTGSNQNPSPAALEKVEQSLDKMIRTMVTLDIEEQVDRARNPLQYQDEVLSAHIETHLLEATKVTLTSANGRSVTGYVLKDAPVLFKYDMSIKQVISMPQDVLIAANNANSNSERNLLMRDYIYNRIMRHDKSNPEKRYINYESIFKAAGYEHPGYQQARNMRRAIAACLDAYKETGVILAWHPYQSMRDKSLGLTTGVMVRKAPDPK